MTNKGKASAAHAFVKSLTPEDLQLLATSDAELKQQASVFCYDLNQFEARVVAVSDRGQQLLQAHLYFDHVITRMLEDALPNPDAINVRRISFYQKVQLVSAMTLLPAELIPPVEFINNLRNRIAHELDFEIGDAAVTDLTNCTPKLIRDAIFASAKTPKTHLEFHDLLRANLIQAEVFRQYKATERLLERKGTIKLATVLDKLEAQGLI